MKVRESFLPGNFFSSSNPWHDPYPPTITNERGDECEWSFSTFLNVLFLFARSLSFLGELVPPAGSLAALTAKKVLATAWHSFNLRITKRYPRQILGLVLWYSYLHFIVKEDFLCSTFFCVFIFVAAWFSRCYMILYQINKIYFSTELSGDD